MVLLQTHNWSYFFSLGPESFLLRPLKGTFPFTTQFILCLLLPVSIISHSFSYYQLNILIFRRRTGPNIGKL